MTPSNAVPAADPANLNEWAIYARVSTEDQAEKYSLASQLRSIREKVARIGGTVPDQLVFVDECSGKDTHRPELQRLRQLVEAKAIKGIGMYTLDRLSRDVVDAVHYHRLCKSKGIRLEFVNLTIDDSPQGEFLYTMLAAVAQLERRTLLERTTNGRAQKAREGHLLSGAVPFGYKYSGKQDGSRGSMVIDDAQAAIVRMIFGYALTGMSAYAIKERLNADGVRTQRAGRTKSVKEAKGAAETVWAGLWSRKTVHQLLTNRTYIGEHIASIWANRGEPMGKSGNHQITIPVDAIIDRQTWDLVHGQRKRNSLARVGRPSRKYLLSGLAWCGRCNHRLTTFPNNGRPIYRCGHTDKFVHARLCDAGGISQSRIEPAVWEAIWDAMSNPNLLWQWAGAYYESMSDRSRQAELEHRCAKLERKVDRARQIVADPDAPLSYAESKKLYDSAQSELGAAREELAKMNVVQMPSRQAIDALCEQFRRGRDLTDFAHRRQLLEQVIKSIRWDDSRREVTIEGLIRFGAGDAPMSVGETPNLNCHRCVSAGDNFDYSIPFILKARVA